MVKKASVTIRLAYFKQGDDMAYYLCGSLDEVEAIIEHAAQMQSVAEHLNKLAALISEEEIEIDADTHFIRITCDKVLADKIVKADLGVYLPEDL